MTSVCTQPFNLEEFLSVLNSKSSASGFLVQGAIQSREYNLNIAFGDFQGRIQNQRSGNATVSSNYLLLFSSHVVWNQDTLIWQYRGSSTIQYSNKNSLKKVSLNSGDIHLVETADAVEAVCGNDSCVIAITNRAFD